MEIDPNIKVELNDGKCLEGKIKKISREDLEVKLNSPKNFPSLGCHIPYFEREYERYVENGKITEKGYLSAIDILIELEERKKYIEENKKEIMKNWNSILVIQRGDYSELRRKGNIPEEWNDDFLKEIMKYLFNKN